MQILVTNDKGTFDATPLALMARWSGDWQQAARSFDFTLLSSASDALIPTVDCPLGAAVQMTEGGKVLFDGFVVSRSQNTEGTAVDLSCYDRGFYLKRNKEFYKFTDQTPEAITARIAADFGFSLGKVEATGVNISRSFLGNNSLYDIIATVYTLASQETGKAYHIGFEADKLCVSAKQPGATTLVITGGSNLIAAHTTESIENMVNRVQIYDENDNFVRAVEDTELQKLYGCLQEVVKQSGDDDKSAEAQKMLDEGGIKQTVSVDNLGNIANVTGGCVVLQEPYTKLFGLFYIESDIHEWKRGQYYNKLTLNYKALMDEKEVGSLPNADGKQTR